MACLFNTISLNTTKSEVYIFLIFENIIQFLANYSSLDEFKVKITLVTYYLEILKLNIAKTIVYDVKEEGKLSKKKKTCLLETRASNNDKSASEFRINYMIMKWIMSVIIQTLCCFIGVRIY